MMNCKITKGSQKQIEWANDIQSKLVENVRDKKIFDTMWKLFDAPGCENQEIRNQFFDELEKNSIQEINCKYAVLRKAAETKEEKKALKEAKEKELTNYKVNFAQKYLNLFFETPQAKDSRFYIDCVRPLLG